MSERTYTPGPTDVDRVELQRLAKDANLSTKLLDAYAMGVRRGMEIEHEAAAFDAREATDPALDATCRRIRKRA